MNGAGVRSRTQTDDHGMALISAVLVTMVVMGLGMTAMGLSMHSLNTSAVDRKRTKTISSAEAGIDLTLQQLAVTPLPCSLSNTLGTGPGASSFTANISYFGPTGVALPCNESFGPVGSPAHARIVSRGTTRDPVYGDRSMNAYAKMTALIGPFDKAIFAQNTISFTNNSTVNGNGGENADVYTNTTYQCSNNQVVRGSVYSQGDILMSNTCSVTGDLWANGRIAASGNGSVGGSVYAAGLTAGSPGSISMGLTTVAKDAVAKGSIAPTPCAPGRPIKGQCSANASPGSPPYQSFPALEWSWPAWMGAGYTVVDEGADCAKLYTDLRAMAVSTTKTVFLTTCTIDWSVNKDWVFATDVAVFSTGGMSTSNTVSFTSADGTPHAFHMIVPYYTFGSRTPTPCGAYPGGTGNLTFSGSTTVSTLHTFIYSPCGVRYSNNQTTIGQIYGGRQVEIYNNFTMTFRPVPVPGGVVSGGGSSSGYTVGLIYKREGPA